MWLIFLILEAFLSKYEENKSVGVWLRAYLLQMVGAVSVPWTASAAKMSYGKELSLKLDSHR